MHRVVHTKTFLVKGTPSSATCGASTPNEHIHGFRGSREGSPEWYPAGFRFDPTLEARARQYIAWRYLLFLWLFPSCRVAGMTDDLSSPHRPVRLLARSRSSTLQISLTCVFPSCFRSSSLPFPWYIRPQHIRQSTSNRIQ